MRVFLVGFMGSGKSTVGRALAQRLGSLFLDLDERIEAHWGLGIPEIFRQHGEEPFRLEETRQIAHCGRFADVVVATGGGTFVREANRRLIQELGTSVFLDVPWGEVQRRLPGKRGERPMFTSPEKAQELFHARLPFYRMADLEVQPGGDEGPEVLAGRIALLLGRCA